MRKLVGWVAVAGALACASVSPRAWVEAYSGPGEVIEMKGMDDTTATVQSQVRGGAGQTLALILGVGGLAGGISTRRAWLAFGGPGLGLGIAILPRMYNGIFATAPASTGLALAQGMPVEVWWAPLAPLLYYPMLALNMVQEPVFWVGILLYAWGVSQWQTRPA